MRLQRKVGRRVAVEGLEDRVVMSSAGVGGYLKGYVNSQPGAVLNIPGAYSTAANSTNVGYKSLNGHEIGVGALTVTATGVAAVVPQYLDPRTLFPARLGFHVTVTQTTRGSSTSTPAIYHLQVTPGPLRPGTAGRVAEAALVQADWNLVSAEQSYSQILSYVPGATEAGALLLQVEAIRTETEGLLAAMDPVVSGQVKSASLGTSSGLPLTLNRTGLAELDQLLTQASAAPGSPINIQPDVESYVTHLDTLQAQDATNNFATIKPAQVAGGTALGGYAGYGSTIAQLTLYSTLEAQSSGALAAFVRNPTTAQADFQVLNGALKATAKSHTVALQPEQLRAYSQTIFAPALQSVAAAEGSAYANVLNLLRQIAPRPSTV